MKLLERFFLSLSSFFPGLILFIFTINICPNVESLMMSLIKIFILISVMLVVAFVSLKYFEEKEISDTATIVSIQPVEHEIIPTYIGLFVIMVGLGSLSFIYQIFIVIFIFQEKIIQFENFFAVLQLLNLLLNHQVSLLFSL